MKYGDKVTLIEDDHGQAMVTPAIYLAEYDQGKHIVRIPSGQIVVDESVIYINGRCAFTVKGLD